MQLTIEIDEDNIAELIEKELTRRILADRDYIGRESKYGVRQGVDKAVKQYTENFGPLTKSNVDVSCGRWTWVDEPWPWEGGC